MWIFIIKDMEEKHTPEFEIKMRAYIAIGLLGSIVLMIAYTLYMYGHILAVLTLILGWLTGTANVFYCLRILVAPQRLKRPKGTRL